MIVIADSGPLHYLILLEQTELLHHFYGEVIVPEAVADELRAVGSPQPVSDWMRRTPSWMKLASVTAEEIASIAGELDLGERAAIALAEKRRADLLLIDETAGRAEARRRGLRVTGTLGVLRTAAEEGLVDVPDVVARLGMTTFYVDEALVRKIFGEWLEE
jgi:predicted nucleic acid-binding protein